MPPDRDSKLVRIQADWLDAWPEALSVWSRFVQLSEPRWCFTTDEEAHEQLSGSFAMIRLVDHAIVVSLRHLSEKGLARFGIEILAHEIGHHVYCPGDLTDNARLLARVRAGLPSVEHHAPLVANLYADLLINDRLQRSARLDLAGVYTCLAASSPSDAAGPLWSFYMRAYEFLWSLPRGTLAQARCDDRLDLDAGLCSRLIRSYARDWLDGAGRFACLCLPYLMKEEAKVSCRLAALWHDTRCAGRGGIPDGLVEIDLGETSGAIHPIEDPDLSGSAFDNTPDAGPHSATTDRESGLKSVKRFRAPFEYAELLKASGTTLSDAEIVARYYRELALPHLVPFPIREASPSVDPHPEGLDIWEVGSPLEEIDWLGSLVASPHVIAGVTTRQRLSGDASGESPKSTPIDLYLGIDCSGSMGNPAHYLSYPILAATVIALSALRVGSQVMAVLSGEPGQTIATDGFLRDWKAVLATLTGYLGTGTTFGVHRLADTFRNRPRLARPVHILIVTDNDIFPMLDQTTEQGEGWSVARDALATAGGGGTIVLQIPPYLKRVQAAQQVIHPGCERLESDGWAVAQVDSMEEMLSFARQFSRTAYASRPHSETRR